MPGIGGLGEKGPNNPNDNDPFNFGPKTRLYKDHQFQPDIQRINAKRRSVGLSPIDTERHLFGLSPIDTERHLLELSPPQVETIYSIQVIRDRLLATKEPAEKAAVIADAVLNALPEAVAFAGRRCVILHWFNESVIEALLEDTNIREKDQVVNVYNQVTSLPFIEHLPWGYTFQDLTREGLLKRFAKAQPELLRSAARLAASAYLGQADDRIHAEALFCFLISGDKQSGDELFDKLTKQADDPQFTANLQDLVTEAHQVRNMLQPANDER